MQLMQETLFKTGAKASTGKCQFKKKDLYTFYDFEGGQNGHYPVNMYYFHQPNPAPNPPKNLKKIVSSKYRLLSSYHITHCQNVQNKGAQIIKLD